MEQIQAALLLNCVLFIFVIKRPISHNDKIMKIGTVLQFIQE